MLGWLVPIATQLARAYTARDNAATDADRIKADVTIKQLEARQASLASGGWITATVQALWALPFIIYAWKLVVWDKVLAWGATDALGDTMGSVMVTIVGFYFLSSGAIAVVRAVKR